MYPPIVLSIATLLIPNLMSQSPLRCGFPTVLFALALAFFGLLPMARAVTPPPDGGYPNANTAEGDWALQSLTSGLGNTAIGFEALFSNTNGNGNTGLGYGALFTSTSGDSNTATGYQALFSNKTGNNNTADSAFTLQVNTSASANTAIGEYLGQAQ